MLVVCIACSGSFVAKTEGGSFGLVRRIAGCTGLASAGSSERRTCELEPFHQPKHSRRLQASQFWHPHPCLGFAPSWPSSSIAIRTTVAA
jgi:hypothetical protein